MTERRAVVGLDPLITSVSVARFVEGQHGGRAERVLVPTPNLPRGDFSIVANVERMTETADRVIAELLPEGGVKPVLAVMMKPLTGPANTDTSGPRRMMLAGEIQRRLVEAGVPVAEIAPMTVSKWLTGAGRRRPDGFAAVNAAVRESWAPSAPESGYRLTTIAVAAAGAVLVGLPTRRPVTDTDLNVLSAMTLPRGWRLAKTADGWHKHFGHATSTDAAEDEKKEGAA